MFLTRKSLRTYQVTHQVTHQRCIKMFPDKVVAGLTFSRMDPLYLAVPNQTHWISPSIFLGILGKSPKPPFVTGYVTRKALKGKYSKMGAEHIPMWSNLRGNIRIFHNHHDPIWPIDSWIFHGARRCPQGVESAGPGAATKTSSAWGDSCSGRLIPRISCDLVGSLQWDLRSFYFLWHSNGDFRGF